MLIGFWREPGIALWVKSLSLALCLVFLAPLLTWAFDPAVYAAGETPFLFQGKMLEIPKKWGTVQESHAGGDRLVIHLQDLHCNYEVQMNIARMIRLLAERHGLRFVAVEGTDRPLNTTKLRTFPLADVREEVADYFVRQGRLSGAEYYAATAADPVHLEGVETQALYARNRKTVDFILREEGQGYSYDLRDLFAALKPRLYPPALLRFDQQCAAFQRGQTSAKQHARWLGRQAGRRGLSLEPFAHVRAYLRQDPEVEADGLFQELDRLEAALREGYYLTPVERELDQQLRRLAVVERMLSLSASPDDVAWFRAERESFRVPVFIEWLRGHDPTGELEIDPELFVLEGYLNAAEDFYAVADQRSVHFAQNLLARMEAQGQPIAVLVTGGFHTQHLLDELKASGVSYLEIKPRLTQQDLINPYFSLLKNQATPLDKLLAQDQTFFSLEPYLPKGDPDRIPNEAVDLNARERLFARLVELFLELRTVAYYYFRRQTRDGDLARKVAETLDAYPARNPEVRVQTEGIAVHRNRVLSVPVLSPANEPMLAVVSRKTQRLPLSHDQTLRLAEFQNETVALVDPAQAEAVEKRLQTLPAPGFAAWGRRAVNAARGALTRVRNLEPMQAITPAAWPGVLGGRQWFEVELAELALAVAGTPSAGPVERAVKVLALETGEGRLRFSHDREVLVTVWNGETTTFSGEQARQEQFRHFLAAVAALTPADVEAVLGALRTGWAGQDRGLQDRLVRQRVEAALQICAAYGSLGNAAEELAFQQEAAAMLNGLARFRSDVVSARLLEELLDAPDDASNGNDLYLLLTFFGRSAANRAIVNDVFMRAVERVFSPQGDPALLERLKQRWAPLIHHSSLDAQSLAAASASMLGVLRSPAGPATAAKRAWTRLLYLELFMRYRSPLSQSLMKELDAADDPGYRSTLLALLSEHWNEDARAYPDLLAHFVRTYRGLADGAEQDALLKQMEQVWHRLANSWSAEQREALAAQLPRFLALYQQNADAALRGALITQVAGLSAWAGPDQAALLFDWVTEPGSSDTVASRVRREAARMEPNQPLVDFMLDEYHDRLRILKEVARHPGFEARVLDYLARVAANDTWSLDVAAEAAAALASFLPGGAREAVDFFLPRVEPDLPRNSPKAVVLVDALKADAPSKAVLRVLRNETRAFQERTGYLVINRHEGRPDLLRELVRDQSLDLRLRLYAFQLYAAKHWDENNRAEFDALSAALYGPGGRDVHDVLQQLIDEPLRGRDLFAEPWLRNEEARVYATAVWLDTLQIHAELFRSLGGAKAIARRITGGYVQSAYRNANAAFRLGGRLVQQAQNPSAFLVWVLNHELMHDILSQSRLNYASDTLTAAVVHELLADYLGAGLGRRYQGVNTDEFEGILRYEEHARVVEADQYHSREAHQGARAQQRFIRNRLEVLGVQFDPDQMVEAAVTVLGIVSFRQENLPHLVKRFIRMYRGAQVQPAAKVPALQALELSLGRVVAVLDEDGVEAAWNLAAVFYRYYQEGKIPGARTWRERLHNTLYYLGEPRWIAPSWEAVFAAPFLAAVLLHAPVLLLAGVFAALGFALVHPRRTAFSRAGLYSLGLGLGGVMALPVLAFGPSLWSVVFGVVLNVLVHAGVNRYWLAARQTPAGWKTARAAFSRLLPSGLGRTAVWVLRRRVLPALVGVASGLFVAGPLLLASLGILPLSLGIAGTAGGMLFLAVLAAGTRSFGSSALRPVRLRAILPAVLGLAALAFSFVAGGPAIRANLPRERFPTALVPTGTTTVRLNVQAQIQIQGATAEEERLIRQVLAELPLALRPFIRQVSVGLVNDPQVMMRWAQLGNDGVLRLNVFGDTPEERAYRLDLALQDLASQAAGEPQNAWARRRVAAWERIYNLSEAGRAWLESVEVRNMVGQPGYYSGGPEVLIGQSFDAAWSRGVRSDFHEVGHTYFRTRPFAVTGRPDLRWDDGLVDFTRRNRGGLAGAYRQFLDDVDAFIQLADAGDAEPLRRWLDAVDNADYHLVEADFMTAISGNIALIQNTPFAKYFDQFLAVNPSTFRSFGEMAAWYSRLSAEDQAMFRQYTDPGLLDQVMAVAAERPDFMPQVDAERLRQLDADFAAKRALVEAEMRQQLVDFADQYPIYAGQAWVDTSSRYWTDYLTGIYQLHQRFPEVLRAHSCGAHFARVFDQLAALNAQESVQPGQVLLAAEQDRLFWKFALDVRGQNVIARALDAEPVELLAALRALDGDEESQIRFANGLLLALLSTRNSRAMYASGDHDLAVLAGIADLRGEAWLQQRVRDVVLPLELENKDWYENARGVIETLTRMAQGREQEARLGAIQQAAFKMPLSKEYLTLAVTTWDQLIALWRRDAKALSVSLAQDPVFAAWLLNRLGPERGVEQTVSLRIFLGDVYRVNPQAGRDIAALLLPGNLNPQALAEQVAQMWQPADTDFYAIWTGTAPDQMRKTVELVVSRSGGRQLALDWLFYHLNQDRGDAVLDVLLQDARLNAPARQVLQDARQIRDAGRRILSAADPQEQAALAEAFWRSLPTSRQPDIEQLFGYVRERDFDAYSRLLNAASDDLLHALLVHPELGGIRVQIWNLVEQSRLFRAAGISAEADPAALGDFMVLIAPELFRGRSGMHVQPVLDVLLRIGEQDPAALLGILARAEIPLDFLFSKPDLAGRVLGADLDLGLDAMVNDLGLGDFSYNWEKLWAADSGVAERYLDRALALPVSERQITYGLRTLLIRPFLTDRELTAETVNRLLWLLDRVPESRIAGALIQEITPYSADRIPEVVELVARNAEVFRLSATPEQAAKLDLILERLQEHFEPSSKTPARMAPIPLTLPSTEALADRRARGFAALLVRQLGAWGMALVEELGLGTSGRNIATFAAVRTDVRLRTVWQALRQGRLLPAAASVGVLALTYLTAVNPLLLAVLAPLLVFGLGWAQTEFVAGHENAERVQWVSRTRATLLFNAAAIGAALLLAGAALVFLSGPALAGALW